MTRTFLIVVVLPVCFHSFVSAQTESGTLKRLSWLAGCWEGGSSGREMTEHWMKPSGGTMIGMSRTVAGGKTREHEFLLIGEREDGVYYIASPSGQKETSFKLVTLADDEAVFENPEHDFPQRIIYRRLSPDSLHARIEGMSKGVLRGVDFPMKRARCD